MSPVPAAKHQGAVIVLDLLGTSRRWILENPLELTGRIDSFLDGLITRMQTDHMYREFMPTIRADFVPVGWRGTALSDSIFIVGDYPAAPDLFMLNQTANHLIETVFEGIDKGFLMRGAISFGEFFTGERAIVGPAIDDAAYWHQRTEWAGTIVTPTCSRIVDALSAEEDPAMEFAKWPVPVKAGGTIDAWALWWPRERQKGKIDALFSTLPMDESVSRKRDNTLRFYDEMMARMFGDSYDRSTGLVGGRRAP
jgi:hypothetical protein